MRMKLVWGMLLLAACLCLSPSANAEAIKIGSTKIASGGPVFIAIDKGYFAEEGLDAQMVFFAASLPVAVATVSGDIDFGSAGLTAALYQLGGQGQLRIIAANARDAAGFPLYAFIVSNKAYEAGLKSYGDVAGKSVALGEVGAPAHYTLSLITAKHGVDLKSVRVLPMQAIVNVISAVTGAQADGGITPASAVLPAIQKGDVKLLGYPGDEVPTQGGAMVIATKTADERGDLVRRYLRALRKGARDYHDAFIGPDEKPRRGPTAPEILAIIAKYTQQPVTQIEPALAYVDADARLDVKDVLHQIAWYKSEGMIKGEVDGDKIIDKRYVVPLTE
ncbi:MAG TPA: ABC transporter substrate-binding protein [Stellaceae bacterium]|jgi:NitT/TauT family transport system substrate-binding protein